MHADRAQPGELPLGGNSCVLRPKPKGKKGRQDVSPTAARNTVGEILKAPEEIWGEELEKREKEEEKEEKDPFPSGKLVEEKC